MNEIIYRKSYREYKAELDGVLQRTAEGFVQIGYLLKVARDTNILEESGYKSVAEFAEAEYNLDKTQVSRFISINDKFSEGGYSDHLLPNYQGYGYAKLTIMLQLPNAINEEISPNFSKAEIQAIKDEVDEEQKVSDLERYMEGSNEKETGLDATDERSAMLYKTILQLGEDDPELYLAISERKSEDLSKVLPEIMAPAGEKMYSVRVRGVGRMMISISEISETVKLINSRSGEKESYTWAELAAGWAYAGVLGPATEMMSGIECWEQRYERKCPVAPVQQQEEKKAAPTSEVKKPKQKETKPKETKPAPKRVTKAKTEWQSAYKVGQQIIVYANDHIGELVEKSEKPGKWKIKFPTYTTEMSEAQFTEYVEDEQIPGQMSVDNYEGVMPEATYEEVDSDGERDTADMPDGAGVVDDHVESETYESTEGSEVQSHHAGDGAKESGGDTEDSGTVEDIWMEIYSNHSKLSKYLAVWESQRTLMESDVLQNLYDMTVAMAAGFERLLRRSKDE